MCRWICRITGLRFKAFNQNLSNPSKLYGLRLILKNFHFHIVIPQNKFPKKKQKRPRFLFSSIKKRKEEWQVCVSLRAIYVKVTTFIYIAESSAGKWKASKQLFSIFSLSTLIQAEQTCGYYERNSTAILLTQ